MTVSVSAEGAELVVRLPLAERAASRSAASSDREERAAAARRRVLVVDDNGDAAETLAELVRLFDDHLAKPCRIERVLS